MHVGMPGTAYVSELLGDTGMKHLQQTVTSLIDETDIQRNRWSPMGPTDGRIYIPQQTPAQSPVTPRPRVKRGDISKYARAVKDGYLSHSRMTSEFGHVANWMDDNLLWFDNAQTLTQIGKAHLHLVHYFFTASCEVRCGV